MELLDFYKAIETKCAVLIGELRAQAEAQTLSAQ